MKVFLPFLLLLLLLSACEKSIENFTENPAVGADTVWATTNSALLDVNLLKTQLARPATTDTFLIQTGASLQTANSLRVDVPANAFNGNVTGTAQSELYFLHTKGDLIRFGKPTLSSGMALQTAGTFYVNFTKNGQSLTLQNGQRFRIAVNDSMPLNNLKVYTGETPAANGFGVFNWRQNDSAVLSATSTGYQLLSNRQQWLCLASGLDTVSQKSRVVLSMPAVFTNFTTLAFIVFKDAACVVQLAPDAGRRIWLAEKIPAGKNVIYITITKKGSDYWLGTQELTTTFNQNVHITPQKKSLQAISDFLDSL